MICLVSFVFAVIRVVCGDSLVLILVVLNVYLGWYFGFDWLLADASCVFLCVRFVL